MPISELTASRKVERNYAIQLRKLARHVGDIIAGHPIEEMTHVSALQAALRRYAEAIRPWATATASRMLAEVAAKNRRSWAAITQSMSKSIREEIHKAPTGAALQNLLRDQVTLITSLPIEAGLRVHELTLKGLETGARFNTLVPEIMRTGEVTKSRATLIARTETARTASVLTEVRAKHIGAAEYIWRTAGDSDVRPTHRALNGKTFRWDDPPECDPGHRANPGQIFNCRCYPEPIIPEDDY